MITYKRNVPEINTNKKLNNDIKYVNYSTFKGIVESSNIFAVDQESLVDAKNVYVDEEGHLVSRPTVQAVIDSDSIPTIIYAYIYVAKSHSLVDIIKIGKWNVYVLKILDNSKFTIIPIKEGENLTYATIGNRALENISQNSISYIDNYIICFTTYQYTKENPFSIIGAQVFDISNPNIGWSSINNYCEIPVVKRIVGTNITTFDKNQLTNYTKEEYIWSNSSMPLLPEGYPDSIKVINNNSTTHWKAKSLENYNNELCVNPDYRLLSKLLIDISNTDIITVAQNVICIARDTYVLISFNNGQAFTQYYYPGYKGKFLNIASISQDSKYFMFVTTDGVYECNIVDIGDTAAFTWTLYYLDGDDSLKVGDNKTLEEYDKIINCVSYITESTFTFMLNAYNDSDGIYLPLGYDKYIYYCGKGLYKENTTNNELKLHRISSNITDELLKSYDYNTLKDCLLMNITADGVGIITLVSPSNALTTAYNIRIIHGGVSSSTSHKGLTVLDTTISRRNWSSIASDYEFKNIKLYAINKSYFETKDNVEYLGLSCSAFIQSTGYTKEISKGDYSDIIFPDGKCIWYDMLVTIEETKDSEGLSAISVSVSATTTLKDYYNSADDYSILDYTSRGDPYKIQGGYVILYGKTGDNKAVLSSYEVVFDKWSSNLLKVEDSEESSFAVGIIFKDYRGILVTGDKFYLFNKDSEDRYSIYTNNFTDTDSAIIDYIIEPDDIDKYYLEVPQCTYSDTELYLGIENNLYITNNTRDENNKLLLNLPTINNQSFVSDISNISNISTNEIAIFLKDNIKICTKVEDETYGYRYDYYNTKLSLSVNYRDSVINTNEGTYTIFPTRRGLAVMNYQAFMSTTDQTLTYITDNIVNIWKDFYNQVSAENNPDGLGTIPDRYIKMAQWRQYLILTNGSKTVLIYDLTRSYWWVWELPEPIYKPITNQEYLRFISITYNTDLIISNYLWSKVSIPGRLLELTNTIVDPNTKESSPAIYRDFSSKLKDISTFPKNVPIDWYVVSQPLHFNAITYYKNIKQLIFHLYDDLYIEDEMIKAQSIKAQIQIFRKKLDVRRPELIDFKIDNLRTFVKRFNYWKINELQWSLSADIRYTTKNIKISSKSVLPIEIDTTDNPQPLKLNGLSIRYEIGEGVR